MKKGRNEHLDDKSLSSSSFLGTSFTSFLRRSVVRPCAYRKIHSVHQVRLPRESFFSPLGEEYGTRNSLQELKTTLPASIDTHASQPLNHKRVRMEREKSTHSFVIRKTWLTFVRPIFEIVVHASIEIKNCFLPLDRCGMDMIKGLPLYRYYISFPTIEIDPIR